MFNKELFKIALKDDFNKTMKPVSENLSTILMVGSIVSMAFGAYKMWTAVPKAQEAIAEKKEKDNSITKLEAAAVAAPYMAGPIVMFGAAAGMMIGSDYISRSRLAAASTVIAGLTASNQKWQEKFKEYTSKEKLQQAKREIFEETTGAKLADEDENGDPAIYGRDVTSKLQREENDLRLNKLTRCVFEDNREFYQTPMKIQEAVNYIHMTYGSTEANHWKCKPFSKNDFTKLLGVDYGVAGENTGYSDADNFDVSMTPAYDSRTGEMFLYVTLPDPDPKWYLPFRE